MQNTPTEGAPVPTRRSSTGRDMTISLVVLLIPLLLVVAIFRLRGGEDVVVVDPSPQISQAQRAGAFPVAVPRGLGAEWRSVSADFSTKDGVSTLRVGYVTPDDGAVQLVQSNEDPQRLLPREFGTDVVPDGQVTVDGADWRSYRIRGDQRALVLTTANRTIVVQGAASRDELAELADATS